MKYNELIALANTIKNANTPDENSAIRIGSTFAFLINSKDVLNITISIPLLNGYYTTSTARAAVPVDLRKQGLEISFQTGPSIWEKEMFIGNSVNDWNVNSCWFNLKNLINELDLNKLSASINTLSLDADNAWQTTIAAYLQLHPEGAFVIIDWDEAANRPLGLPTGAQAGTRYNAFAMGNDNGGQSIILINNTNKYLYVYNLQNNTISRKLSATDLKTINGESVIGVGDIVIEGGTGGGTITDYFHSSQLSVTGVDELDNFFTSGNYGLYVADGFQSVDNINMTLVVSKASGDGTGGDGNDDILQCIILQSGVEYFRVGKSVNSILFVWTEWEIKSGASEIPVIPNEVNTAITVGGIPAGTYLFGKNALEVIDLMLYPELFPALTAPTSTFSTTKAATLEVGTSLNIDLNAVFNQGSINPQYTATSDKRSGLPSMYSYTGSGLIDDVDHSNANLSDTFTVPNYSILFGANAWNNSIAYLAGVQPKSSKGNDSNLPLDGSFISKSLTITGKYYRFSGIGATPSGIDATACRTSIIGKSPVFQNNSASSFVLATGNTETNFFVCLPFNLAVLSALDTTANAAVTFTLSGTYVMKDAGGTEITYHMYTATIGSAFASSHNWTINIG